MSLVTAALLALLSAPPSEAEMPADFLQVESPAWSKWLDEEVNCSWQGIPLKRVLATEFGTAAMNFGNAKVLETRINFASRKLPRRVALWRMSQQFDFTVEWAQKGEPRTFMGLSEAEHRELETMGVTVNTVTHVMRADYEDYLDLKRKGKITEEEFLDGILYYAKDVHLDLNFGDIRGHTTEVHRYKTTVPPDGTKVEAIFTAKVQWIEMMGRREAVVIPVELDPRYLVGIEVLSVEKAGYQFEAKEEVILAIHSPARLFHAYPERAPGKLFKFKSLGKFHQGCVEFYYAEARQKSEAKKDGVTPTNTVER